MSANRSVSSTSVATYLKSVVGVVVLMSVLLGICAGIAFGVVDLSTRHKSLLTDSIREVVMQETHGLRQAVGRHH